MSPSFTCIIVDDEPLAIRLLKAHVAQVPQLELLGTFENPVNALTFLRATPVDLLLLDIQMPVITGLEFARTVPTSTKVIFTTAYREFAVESYELNVVDYLVKPITFSRFYQAFDKFLLLQTSPAPAASPSKINTQTEEAFRYINVNKKHIKVYFQDITYVESLKDYICIHTTTDEVVTREKISDFAAKAPGHFLRTHRSYLVNVDRISAYTAHDIEIGTVTIPIGASYKQHVMRHLK
ncbi:MAG: response regulator transcription factor [Bacteroidota bacterium]